MRLIIFFILIFLLNITLLLTWDLIFSLIFDLHSHQMLIELIRLNDNIDIIINSDFVSLTTFVNLSYANCFVEILKIKNYNIQLFVESSNYHFRIETIYLTKMNYLNYLKTEHIIDMMLALHSDHQRQMRSIVDVMSMNEQEMIIIILQKNSIKTKDIQKKLHKLRVLYEFNERRNNELMLWEKMKSLTEMIEKLMRQRIAALTVNQCMKNQLKRLKKIMSRLKKEFVKKKEHVDSWAKKVSMKSTTSFESHLVFNVNISSLVQNHCKKFKVKIFIKENHDNNNEEHSEISEKDWRWLDVVNTQEHRNNEKMIETVNILSSDKEQQENIEEKWFLNQRDIVECIIAWSQFWSSDTWN